MRINIGVLFAIAVLSIIPAGVQAQSDDGLVGEWHFDEGAGSVVGDSSGNGNDGVIRGATWVKGKYGGALSFDGVDDYVTVGIINRPTNTFTFEAWIKSEATHQIDGQSTSGTRGTSGQRYAFFPSHGGSSNAGAGLSVGTNGISVYEHGSSYMPALAVYSDNIGTGWNHIAVVYSNKKPSIYLNGILVLTGYTSPRVNVNTPVRFGMCKYGSHKGCIDEVRVYNRALTTEEINEHYEQGPTALSITKTATPNSIKQGQTTTITLTVKNTGSTEINDIEIADTNPPDITFIEGETSKTYVSLSPQDSRQFQYEVQLDEAGTFNLEPAVASYSDDEGNYKTIKSKPATIEVIPSIVNTGNVPNKKSNGNVQSASVNLHGEKTDVALGEDVLLKLSAVNIIGNPTMHVQVIIIPPSGWSVTSSEFAKSAAGQYTTTYELEPGGGKDIEVRIVPNQIGDEFQVDGRIIYYFGDDVETREDHTLSLPITVRAQAVQTSNNPQPAEIKSPGFELVAVLCSIFFIWYLISRK